MFERVYHAIRFDHNVNEGDLREGMIALGAFAGLGKVARAVESAVPLCRDCDAATMLR